MWKSEKKSLAMFGICCHSPAQRKDKEQKTTHDFELKIYLIKYKIKR